MTRRTAKPAGVFTRDAPDLPRDLPEADTSQLFAEPDVRISELLVHGFRLPEAASLSALHLDSCWLRTVALPSAVVRAAKWKDVRLSECDLANAEIRALTAIRVEFLGCRMTGLRLNEASWQNVLVSGGDQRYAQFRFSALQKSEFEGCDLQDADFYGADLRGCVFRRCNLRNVEMSKAKLEGTDFRGSNIEGLRVGLEDVAGAIVDAAQALSLAPLLGIRIL